jgi:hypothetical protein
MCGRYIIIDSIEIIEKRFNAKAGFQKKDLNIVVCFE